MLNYPSNASFAGWTREKWLKVWWKSCLKVATKWLRLPGTLRSQWNDWLCLVVFHMKWCKYVIIINRELNKIVRCRWLSNSNFWWTDSLFRLATMATNSTQFKVTLANRSPPIYKRIFLLWGLHKYDDNSSRSVRLNVLDWPTSNIRSKVKADTAVIILRIQKAHFLSWVSLRKRLEMSIESCQPLRNS